mgnify:CR=1 FL=1
MAKINGPCKRTRLWLLEGEEMELKERLELYSKAFSNYGYDKQVNQNT